MSQRIDALICPRWTIPVEPEIKVSENICMAVDKGRILDLLPRAAAEARFQADAVHERPQHVLMPGLVNAHTHAAMTLMRGFGDDLPLDIWLNERIWPTEMKLMSPEFVVDGTRLAIAEMLRGGITCFADMYFYPDRTAETAVEAGMRSVVGMIAIEFPTPWAADAGECISKGLAVHDTYRGHPLVSTMFAPHAPYTVSDETFKRIRQLADELELPIQMHIHETAGEVETAQAEQGQRPLQRLEAPGSADARPHGRARHAAHGRGNRNPRPLRMFRRPLPPLQSKARQRRLPGRQTARRRCQCRPRNRRCGRQ